MSIDAANNAGNAAFNIDLEPYERINRAVIYKLYTDEYSPCPAA